MAGPAPQRVGRRRTRAAAPGRPPARPAGRGMRSTFAALGIRNYRLYAVGGLVSNTGTWMQRVAQDWLVLALTGSAGALGLTTGLQFLPIVLFS
ncbi:MAG: MFS transporter, partial [Desertimonas sp.]